MPTITFDGRSIEVSAREVGQYHLLVRSGGDVIVLEGHGADLVIPRSRLHEVVLED